MAEKLWDYLRGFTVILSDVVLCCLFLMLVPLVMHWETAIALPLWILTAALQLLIGNCMISCGVSWSAYLAVQGAAIVAGSIVTVRASWFSVYEADMGVALAACTVLTGLHSAFASYRLPGSNGIMRFVDLLVGVTAFYLYAVFQTGMPGDQRLLAAVSAALALDLLTVNHLRTGGEGGSVIRGAGAGSRLVLAAVLAGCLLITGVIVGMASGQIHSAVDLLLLVLHGIYRVLAVVFTVIGQVLAFIILFLVALLPMSSQRTREYASAQVEQRAEELLGETGTQLSVWILGAVLGAVLLILAGWVLYQLRDVRIQRIPKSTRRRRVVRRSHLLEALSGIWSRMWQRLVFEWEYLRHKNSPQGLFVLAERVGKQKKLARRPDESPGAYIRRFCRVLRQQQEAAADISVEAVEQLAELLDQIFYAGRADVPEAFDCRLCARQIRLCYDSLRATFSDGA